jgi:hypothetical protein
MQWGFHEVLGGFGVGFAAGDHFPVFAVKFEKAFQHSLYTQATIRPNVPLRLRGPHFLLY